MTSTSRILVLGLTAAGRASLPDAMVQRVLQADVLVGGQRQLDCFADAGGERLLVNLGLEHVVRRLRAALTQQQRAVVLASGDPLCYGIGSSLRRFFAPAELEVVPAASAFQLAFAALAEPWHDALLLSAHNRPLETVVQRVRQAAVAAILTDQRHTPAAIAQALLEDGTAADTRCAICENLGYPEERILLTTLHDACHQLYEPLNVMVVWCIPIQNQA
ncbi:MAG: precorrin-6y C5,15-methyltransferase (decarboxylating) subunit CbiE [Chloroflexaceae bacterium]|nr:precorrin-6y C5,15-methyltransferase (decarboxylating) subunit CbiE [Chloroflexaceae bacterium]